MNPVRIGNAGICITNTTPH